eukprot:3066725-Pyramimonas_sp.AAC.1
MSASGMGPGPAWALGLRTWTQFEQLVHVDPRRGPGARVEELLISRIEPGGSRFEVLRLCRRRRRCRRPRRRRHRRRGRFWGSFPRRHGMGAAL